jgi:hypothetical protein
MMNFFHTILLLLNKALLCHFDDPEYSGEEKSLVRELLTSITFPTFKGFLAYSPRLRYGEADGSKRQGGVT